MKASKGPELVVIATKYKNRALRVDYYTKSGKPVSKEKVIRETDSKGAVRYYCSI
ncbi:hypothetical protein M1523_01755 [Patescibacteria group bacterium]|nr:hypothetical protein [Patescibacteria group bacterium]